MAVNSGAEETAATDVTKETAAADVTEEKAAVDDINKSAVIDVAGKSTASTCGTGGLGNGKSGGGDGVGGTAKGKSGGLEGGGGVQVRRSGGGDGGVEERGRVQRCEHPVEESTADVCMGAVSADVAEHASAEAEAESVKNGKRLRAGLTHPAVLLSGGGTPAARRRQRRTEAELAAVQHILAGELRERQQERARVLRAMAQRSIERVQRQQVAVETRRQEVRSVIDAVKKLEVAAMQASLPPQPTSDGRDDKLATRGREKQPAQKQEVVTSRPRADVLEAEWLACERQWLDELPVVLAEEGTLAEMRAARKRAVKAVKKYKVPRRAYRLQRRRQQEDQRKAVGVESQQTKVKKRSRQKKGGYAYAKQGNYGDVELVSENGGKTRREAQLRAAGAGEPSCLPIALLAFTRRHTQEVRLDSCAQFSVAGCELRKFGRCLTRDAPIDVVVGFGGGRSRVLGVWRFLGTTQYQQRVTIDALVVEGQGSEFLVGEDWMVERQAKMDFGARELKYRDSDGRKVILPFTCHGVTTLQQAGEQRQATVRLAKTIKLATNTQSVVRVTVDAADGTTGIFVPKAGSKRHLLMAPTLDTVQDGMVRVAVLNIEGRREKLPARAALGTWVPTEDTMKILEMNGELERARVAKWVSTLRKEDAAPLTNEASLQIGDMEPKDKDLFIALLRQYAEIIEKKEGCPPLAKVNVQHHINTGDAAPIMLRRRRHAVSENAIIDKEVDEMLRDEVIEEGEGAWGFPVVLVRKKDGSVRFCIDYRALNAVTIKDVYPLPRVDETLEALYGSRRFTSLDLHAGYWQLGVAEEDKAKTAFTTRRGLFQFRRMPFGLCNAPSTFQRLMDCVLRGLTWVCCLVYLDDVVIFSQGTVARHVVELAVVLERLAEAGLSLKAAKCSFDSTRMEYLGHELTTAGIQPTDRLVKAIVDFPTPTDDAQVRRFVALAGYYRRFVPEFGAKLSPLTCLLRKTSKWEWGAAQEEAFTWAKAWLSTKPVLIYPDYSLPFKLTTDASKAGLGAVLSQDQGRGDQPVAYASKVNSPAVSKYTISELECLAVVWAVRLFRPHLYGRRFTVVTDHVALKWLMTAKEPAGRLHRWALTLQEYDFDIIYRPGKENCVADALSRGPAGPVEVIDEVGREGGPEDEPAIRRSPQDGEVQSGEPAQQPEGSQSSSMVVERALSSQEGSGDESVCANAVAELVAAEVKLLADAQQVVRTGKQELAQLAVQRLREETTTTEQTPPADAAAAARCLQSGEVADAVAADIDRAADEVVRAVSVQRVEAAEMGIVQFTDDDIRREQQQSVMVRALKERGSYQGQRVFTDEAGLINIETEEGEARVVLPAVYWALAFKEAHDSIWAGHLRGPQTFERVRQLYWWPKMREAVQHWVSACQDCGSRKARPKAVVPPLRSVRTGAVCDRWAIDVAGPLPVTASGHRYVIAAMEYTTRYAVAAAVPEHTAKSIARFLMDKVVLVYGPMREIMMDGAMEFSSKATGELLDLLQVKQSTPVPYRPKLLGLVERFHRTWKDIVSLYVDENQDDWDDFLPCALYAHNSSKHATHGYQPNELMMGRKLRTPAELLRRNRLAHPHRTLDAYHEVLLRDLETANELAALALQKEQARQAMYYNQRNVRSRSDYRAGQLVWMYRPARGPKITKFGHKWIGPGQVIEQAGYDNYRTKMLESGHELVTHCSFLVPYYYPTNLLEQMAKDIAIDLHEEAVAAGDAEADLEGEGGAGIAGEGEGAAGATPTSCEATSERSTDTAAETPRDEAAPQGTERSSPISGAAADDNPPTQQPPSRLGDAAESAEGSAGRGEADDDRSKTIAGVDADTDGQQARQDGANSAAASSGRSSVSDAATRSRSRDPDTGPRQQRRRKRARAEGAEDTVASRTRARIRRTPYPGQSAADGDGRNSGPGRAYAPETALVDGGQEAAAPGEQRSRSAARNEDEPDQATRREEEVRTEPTQHAGEEEEPVVYVFTGRGRRDTDSVVSTRPRIPLLQPNEAVVERRRRRYRTKTGRYVLEFEVERVGHRPDEVGKLWINQHDYEQLWREGRMRSSADTTSDSEESNGGGRRSAEDEIDAVAAARRDAVAPQPVVDEVRAASSE